jgi:O-acetyl-ADP-ribose deacetylase (regulator of RNase III)
MQIQLLRADIASLKVDAIVNASESAEQSVSGGNLLCRFIIQTPIPRPGDPDADARIRHATLTSLQRADELAVASIALPLMCSGVVDDATTRRCAEIMIETTYEFAMSARSLQRVVFCLFGEPAHGLFSRVLRERTR